MVYYKHKTKKETKPYCYYRPKDCVVEKEFGKNKLEA